ncbi:alpha/beta fold hydrolase [Promicromonospora sp. NPDC057488]|uniref:alpha/beta fold hydrolase n=1 Tax=Promicromonospora sp. NPDC057488 TaxID=3346147 RepID=UPI0036731F13
MPVVFVHGVPEAGVIWNGLRTHLPDMPTVALDLPGFGPPRPAGFTATKDDYAAWLVDALHELDGPVDVVGHDWGSGIVLRAVTAFDAPVRSWTVDTGAAFHRDYVWHDLARVWQTPGLGEQWMSAFVGGAGGAPGRVRAALRAAFANEADAALLGTKQNEIMGACILDLYRSAVPNVFADWGDALTKPTPTPGLVLQATADHIDDAAASTEVAGMLGARTATLDGLGHWWMLQNPAAGAAALRTFWAMLDR